jgi:hypothetical protein
MKKSAPKAKKLVKTEKHQKQSMKKALKVDTSKKNSKTNRGALALGLIPGLNNSVDNEEFEVDE